MNFIKHIKSKFISLLYLTFISSNIFSQSRSGRGYDWWDDDSVSSGDGAAWIYFLIFFWLSIFFIQLFYAMYEELKSEYKTWLKSIYSFLKKAIKILVFASISVGIVIFFYYAIDNMNIRLPRYMDYVGNFLICIFWIAIIRYLVFENVSSEKIRSFFKTRKGMVSGFLIGIIIFVLTFG